MSRNDPEYLAVRDALMDETIDLIRNGIYRKLPLPQVCLVVRQILICYDPSLFYHSLCIYQIN